MYDAIVVGAGPGGCLTSYRLARDNAEVCLIEKETLPRYKPCGGGLPPHAVSLMEDLDVTIDSYVEYVADEVKFLFDFEDPVVTDLSDAPVVMVNRADFDGGLVDQAREEGVEFREGVAVSDVSEVDDECRVTLEDDTTIRSEFVVGADGAGSRVAKSMGLNREQSYGVALDAEVEVDPDTYEREEQYATFNINFVDKGYGWIFPKDRYLALGVGGYDTTQPYPELVRNFVDRSLPEAEVKEMDVYGHPLPFFESSQPLATDRVALIGDAANMVDSLSGEGIFYALKAGNLAAESILDNLENGYEDLSNYQQAVSNTVVRELEWSSKLASVFFQFPRKCYEHGVKRTTIVNLIKRVVRSEQSYDEIYGAIWDEIKQRMNPSTLKSLAFQ